MLKPSGFSAARIRRASRRAASIVRSRSSSAISNRSAECVRGTTSAWPRVAGFMSMNATVCSSESTICAGTSPATIPQKRQSLPSTAAQLICRPARRLHEPAGERDRVVSARDLARVDGGLDLADDPPELRPGIDSQLGGELVPRQRRAWRTVTAPVEGGRKHLAGEIEMSLDHLCPGNWALSSRRKAIGDAQDRHVRPDRIGVAKVLVYPPGRQRALSDEKPQAQMVKRETLEVTRQPPARLQSLAQRAHDPRPLAVVADERDVVAVHLTRGRLAEVVNDGAEAQRASPSQLVGERLGQEIGDLRRALARVAL